MKKAKRVTGRGKRRPNNRNTLVCATANTAELYTSISLLNIHQQLQLCMYNEGSPIGLQEKCCFQLEFNQSSLFVPVSAEQPVFSSATEVCKKW